MAEHMKVSEFWKNFRLGEELSISGTFIYNSLRRFHELRNLDFTDELFEFLYDASVGLERLLKIAVVLYEHDEAADQEKLEKSLITHNHLDLLARLRKKVAINFGSPHVDFLSLVGKFYKSLRYDRFTLASTYDTAKERTAICRLLSKHLQIEIKSDTVFLGTPNEDRYRKFIGRTILRIAEVVYQAIDARARELNLYTYELRHGSKAESVFLRRVDINHEDVLWKELLVFFMNTKSSSGYLEFLRSISPLDFDPELTDEYLDCFKSDGSKSNVMDELEHHYQEMEGDISERLELIATIGAPGVYFPSLDEESDGSIEGHE